MLTSVPNDNGICFCRGQNSENVVSCSNVECPYGSFTSHVYLSVRCQH